MILLDLFAGVGGTALGIQNFLEDRNITYSYYAVEYDNEIIKAHELFRPQSIVIEADAYIIVYSDLREYAFIWASPPCQSHSQCNMFWDRRNPDMRLWDLINYFKELSKPFIVENVKPYYKPLIKPTLKIRRHYFWSNLPLEPFEFEKSPKGFTRMSIEDWRIYHNVPKEAITHIRDLKRRRQILRNMVHWSISYNLFKQVYDFL